MVKNGLRAPENMKLAGDWMFWIQILLANDVVFLAEPLNFFREPHRESQRYKTNFQALELMKKAISLSLISNLVIFTN